MEVEPTEPRSCAACGEEVRGNLIIRARWYTYRDPSGWEEWGQICGVRLNHGWRSMGKSWDWDINDASTDKYAVWKKGLFMKVILRRLQGPQPAGIEEEPIRGPEQYELKRPVDPNESDDEWE